MYTIPLQSGDRIKWPKGHGCVLLDKGNTVIVLIESGEEEEIKKTKLKLY